MGRHLTAKQFLGWEAYAALDPFDEKRADYRAASIREMVYNMAVAPKDRKPQIEDFLLTFSKKKVDEVEKPDYVGQTWQEKQMLGRIIAEAYANSKEA